MLSTTTTGAYVDHTTHELLLDKFYQNKKYKEEILKKIIADVCAMLNGSTSGGKVVVNIIADSNDISASQRSSVLRILEQHLITIIGTNITAYVNFHEDKKSVTIFVEKSGSLITINYHLYLPSQTQVLQVPPSQPQEKVKDDIVNRNAVRKPVQLESHTKMFLKSKECGLSETKTVQLKNVKADASNRTRLADRMTGKSNKFSCYVSAFANYNGGHIYYGIDDDGVVAGEFIPNEVDKSEITKKVEKSISKMIWPEQPKRKVHWEIFFEPVLDDNSTPISSTFVIVIYIAPCLGGVFTEEPECYEMVEGEVVKMSFTTWMKRILQPIELSHVPITHLTVKRSTWSSSRIQRICSYADEQLLAKINKGKSIEIISDKLVKIYPDLIELRLLILAKKVMASYRSCSFKAAREVLDEYEKSLGTTTEFWMFDAIRLYLEIAICTAQGDVEAVNNILHKASYQAARMKRGRISAALYLLSAVNLLQRKGDGDNSPVEFSTRALEDLKYVQDLPKVRADMEQKAQIILALFYLGCNGFGVPIKKVIDRKCFEQANCNIMAVRQSIYEGNLMSPYRELQFSLVQSIFFYRKSQVQPEGKMSLLKEAFDTSKKAEAHAITRNFQDLVNWSRDCMALSTE